MRRPRRAAVGVLSPRRPLKLGKIRRRACLRLIPFLGTGDVLLAPTMIIHPLAYVVSNPRQLSGFLAAGLESCLNRLLCTSAARAAVCSSVRMEHSVFPLTVITPRGPGILSLRYA